jgi:succinate-semialdehyde dehydrogenase/glutarate-semialdehyde dehydrogenase
MKNSQLSSLTNKNSLFLSKQWLLGGKWQKNSSSFIKVYDPSQENGLIGEAPSVLLQDINNAIVIAKKSLKEWKNTSPHFKSTILHKWASLQREKANELAEIISMEQGKPFSEAVNEINYSASFFDWFGGEVKRIEGQILPSSDELKKHLVVQEPVGPVAIITPWNFPIAMLAKKIPAALAAGCTLIVKPSELTPFSAYALCELGLQAGLPEGVISCLTTNDPAIFGDAIFNSSDVRKISFTGSTRVGKLLMKEAARTVKRTSMELGGNAPFIVFDDASIKGAVDGLLQSKFRNCGQTCVSPNRILVQDKVFESFVKELISTMERILRVGPWYERNNNIGPLINREAVKKVQLHLDDALGKGASLVYQMKGKPSSGNYFPPTVITNVSQDMMVMQEETFGPLVPVYKFQTDSEALEIANSTDSGLAAYFYAQNMQRIWRISANLQVGMVGVNTGAISLENAPFGGIKESGIGREGGSKYGVSEYLETKFINISS